MISVFSKFVIDIQACSSAW